MRVKDKSERHGTTSVSLIEAVDADSKVKFEAPLTKRSRVSSQLQQGFFSVGIGAVRRWLSPCRSSSRLRSPSGPTRAASSPAP